jgi:hypothetical protein
MAILALMAKTWRAIALRTTTDDGGFGRTYIARDVMATRRSQSWSTMIQAPI